METYGTAAKFPKHREGQVEKVCFETSSEGGWTNRQRKVVPKRRGYGRDYDQQPVRNAKQYAYCGILSKLILYASNN